MTRAADILEAANRVARRGSLLEFVKDCTPGYQAGWMHEEICRELEEFQRKVEAGERPRYMLFCPPRHGKSQISSRAYPAWALSRDPSLEIMVVSYSADLANSFSYDCRTILKQDWYCETFPNTRLEGDRKGISRWKTTAGGGFLPLGVGGSLTGSGASILVIDDVVKNEAEARSAKKMDEVYRRYQSSMYSRLAPGGGCLILMTRWSDQDLAGRLLAAEADGHGDKWRVVKYPAIATHDEKFRKQGEALHPERFPLEVLEEIRQVSGPDEWSSLYQQDPVPVGGEYVREDWVRRFDLDEVLQSDIVWDAVIHSWDTSFKDTVRSDRTACAVFGLRQGNYYLLHAWAGKMDFNGVCDKIVEIHEDWGIDRIPARRCDIVVEARANGMGIIRYLSEVVGLTNIRGFDPQKAGGGKEARANIASGYWRGGRVYMPFESHGRSWVRETFMEYARFPSGAYDDAVDAMTQAIIYGRRMGNDAKKRAFAAGKPIKRQWATRF